MSTVKTVKYQVGTDGTSTNNFTIYQPDPPDGTMRVGNGNADAPTDVAQVNGDGFKFTSNIQIGTDATSSNNFTIYQPATPDGTLRIGVGNADNPTEVGQFNANGYKPATAPAFSAYLSADQSVSSGVITKIQFDTEEFDTNNNFDNATNYRFTPTVSGYYQINASFRSEGSSLTAALFYIYKNGSSIYIPALDTAHSSTTHMSGSTLVHCNGTSDYIEIYGRIDGSSPKFGNDNCRFSAFLAQQS